MQQDNIWSEYKIVTLSVKYGKDIRKLLEYKKGKLYYNGVLVYKLTKKTLIKTRIIRLNRRKVTIIGNELFYLPKEDFNLYVNVNDKDYLIKKYKVYRKEPSIIGVLDHYREFKLKIPLKSKKTVIKFKIENKGEKNNLCQSFGDKDYKDKKKITINKLFVTAKQDKDKIVIKKKKII